MSFGYSVGDFLLLTQLAYRTVQNARKACGAHDDLAREVSSLHIVLQRVGIEVSKPDSILNNNEDNRRKELQRLGRHCERVLKVLEQILDKYNALPDEKRSVMKLWQKVKFGNGEMLDMGKIRSELATHTQALNMFLNLLSIGSQGKVEKYMDSHGEDLREIKDSLHWVTASMQASSHEEKSILTTYAEDDKAIWKTFRRELIKEGFSCHLLDQHKKAIKKYVMELGERGALDEPVWQEDNINDITSSYLEVTSQRIGTDRPADDSLDVTQLCSGQEISSSDGDNRKAAIVKQKSNHIRPIASSSAEQVRSYTSTYSSSDESEDTESDEGEHGASVSSHRSCSAQQPSAPAGPNENQNGEKDEASSTSSYEFSSPNTESSSVQLAPGEVEQNAPLSLPANGVNLHNHHEWLSPSILPPPPHSKYRPPFIQDTEDEDFVDGAHPNCIADVSDEEENPQVFTSSFESQLYRNHSPSLPADEGTSNSGKCFEEHDRDQIQDIAEGYEGNEASSHAQLPLPGNYRDVHTRPPLWQTWWEGREKSQYSQPCLPLTRERLLQQQQSFSGKKITGTEKSSVHDEVVEFFQQRCLRQSKYAHKFDDSHVTPDHWSFLNSHWMTTDVVSQSHGVPGKIVPDDWEQIRSTSIPGTPVPDALPSVRGSTVNLDAVDAVEARQLLSLMPSDNEEGFFWPELTACELLNPPRRLDLGMCYLHSFMTR